MKPKLKSHNDIDCDIKFQTDGYHLGNGEKMKALYDNMTFTIIKQPSTLSYFCGLFFYEYKRNSSSKISLSVPLISLKVTRHFQ